MSENLRIVVKCTLFVHLPGKIPYSSSVHFTQLLYCIIICRPWFRNLVRLYAGQNLSVTSAWGNYKHNFFVQHIGFEILYVYWSKSVGGHLSIRRLQAPILVQHMFLRKVFQPHHESTSFPSRQYITLKLHIKHCANLSITFEEVSARAWHVLRSNIRQSSQKF